MSEPAQPVAAPAPALPAADPTKTHMLPAVLKHGSPLIACRFDRAGRFVFAGAEDLTIRRFDLASGAQTGLAGHVSWVRSLVSLHDDATLVSGGYDGRLIWWPLAAEARRWAWPGGGSFIRPQPRGGMGAPWPTS